MTTVEELADNHFDSECQLSGTENLRYARKEEQKFTNITHSAYTLAIAGATSERETKSSVKALQFTVNCLSLKNTWISSKVLEVLQS